MRLTWFSAVFGLLLSGFALAGINAYEFKDPATEARFRVLITELRCPKCQNQDIADSDAPLAKDLKDIIYDKLNAGESDQQILDFMQKRYGDFILYRPPMKPKTWILWFGPGIFLVLGIALLVRRVRRKTADSGLSEPEYSRLEALLRDVDKT